MMQRKKNKASKKKRKPRFIVLTERPFSPPKTVAYPLAMQNLQQLIQNGNFLDAQHQALQLIQALPSELDPNLLLLHVYLGCNKFKEAKQLVDNVLTHFPKHASAYRECSRYYLQLNDSDQAIELVERAIKLDSNSDGNYFLLGHIYGLNGDKELALSAYEQAITINPNNGAAHHARARLVRDKVSRKYLESLESKLKIKKMHPHNRCCLHFAAAWSYGDADPERQFHHLKAGNELVQALNPWDYQAHEHALKSDRTFVNRAFIEAVAPKSNSSFSPIFITSLPRSGTTLLEQILGAHSRINPIGESNAFHTARNQVAFRNGVAPELHKWKNAGNVAKYLPQLDTGFRSHPALIDCGELRPVDKSMSNITDCGLILLTYPDAKIIHLQRDPMDVVLSCHQLLFEGNSSHLSTLENIAHLYQNSERHMAYWKQLFPEKIITVSYEDLVTDQNTVVHKILDFCELPWEDACLQHHKSISLINTASYMQVRRPIHKDSVGRWRPYAKFLKPAADILGIEYSKVR